MNTLEDRIYAWLTHGHAKNGINWHDAMDTAKAKLNHMDHVEFLELISHEISDMLRYKEDAK
jgi:hypothetical protein